eukprot:TRINITY_DN2057_c0_g1_i1.p2 TRINITY_DN2057_c0_g1~~TRINITY_DN2057_c0_g1_i1.p2  ORF type:complete len:103 (+),score=37.84 TRINITY_DN2057_c0_g1_i1:147-455(+)
MQSFLIESLISGMQITFSSKIENAKTLHLIEKSEQIEQNIYVDVYGTLDIFELEEKARLVTVSQGICGKALEKGGMAWRCPCLLYTSPSPRDQRGSRMPSSA